MPMACGTSELCRLASAKLLRPLLSDDTSSEGRRTFYSMIAVMVGRIQGRSNSAEGPPPDMNDRIWSRSRTGSNAIVGAPAA